MNRREFTLMTTAALGGAIAGARFAAAAAAPVKDPSKPLMLQEPHVCRGLNTCKGMGDCAVPLGDDAWSKARKNYEAAMKKAGKKFGAAPAKKK